MVTAAASVIIVLSTNFFNCMFHISICGANSIYGGSSLAHHLKHLPHHNNHLHSIHLTMALLVMVILVALVGL